MRERGDRGRSEWGVWRLGSGKIRGEREETEEVRGEHKYEKKFTTT